MLETVLFTGWQMIRLVIGEALAAPGTIRTAA
jgi:hypothetical protein